jgi:hypothetical protein
MKIMFQMTTNKLTTIACVTGLITVLAWPVAAQEFRVEGAGLEAVPTSYHGPCPGLIRFKGKIQASARGHVRYTYYYSDGATGPEGFVDFEGPGVKQVETTWTLGGASLTHYEGWGAIRVLSPNIYVSNRANFDIDCQLGKGKQPDAQPVDRRHDTLIEAPQTELPNPATAVIGEPFAISKGQLIACPVKEVRTEVTTPLPKPWWNTPQIGKLERVSVQTIGGKRTLVCEYWAYGRTVSIMREVPKGATNCSAEGNGFLCR